MNEHIYDKTGIMNPASFVHCYMKRHPEEISIKPPPTIPPEREAKQESSRISRQYCALRIGDTMHYADKEGGELEPFVVAAKSGAKAGYVVTSTEGKQYPLNMCRRRIDKANDLLSGKEPMPRSHKLSPREKADRRVYNFTNPGDSMFYVNDKNELIRFVVRAKAMEKGVRFLMSENGKYPAAMCRKRRDNARELIEKKEVA